MTAVRTKMAAGRIFFVGSYPKPMPSCGVGATSGALLRAWHPFGQLTLEEVN